ncbi:MAG: NAD(P)H-dependent oxidoreductase [Pseudomonadota bacterium]
MSSTVLRIDSSARRTGSVTRELASKIIARLNPSQTITRDVSHGIPQINEGWIEANFTPAADRSDTQKGALALSDELVDELKAADTIVIGLPIYNFGVPAALKAWIDQVARAGLTFKYTETGPQGLLEGKRAIVAVASGGTQAGSDIDFATGYIRHVLGFIGITEVEFVNADRLMVDADASLQAAEAQVNAIAA